MQELEIYNTKIANSLRYYYLEQVNKNAETLSECQEESEDSDTETEQENMHPNKLQSPEFKSQAIMNLLKSQGMKLQVGKGSKVGLTKAKFKGKNKK